MKNYWQEKENFFVADSATFGVEQELQFDFPRN